MFWFSIFIMTTIDNAAMQCESSKRIEIRSSAITGTICHRRGEEELHWAGIPAQLDMILLLHYSRAVLGTYSSGPHTSRPPGHFSLELIK